VTKKYQIKDAKTNDALGLAVPAAVNVAMNEIAADMREGLLALAVGAGLQVMQSLMEADVTAVCGPRGRHDPARSTVRHGREAGSVTLGGRRVPVTRPRVRAVEGAGELAVPSYELFSGTEVLGKMAMERMLAGLSTRRYGVGLEPVGEQVAAASSSTSKSAVSRKFVAMTEHSLTELLAADLSTLDLVAFMVDGVHFAEHCCIVALGIGIDAGHAPAGAGGGRGRERDAGAAQEQLPKHRPDRRRGLRRTRASGDAGVGRCGLRRSRGSSRPHRRPTQAPPPREDRCRGCRGNCPGDTRRSGPTAGR